MFTYHIINKDAFTMVLPEGEMAYGACNQLEGIVSAHMGPGGVLSFNMEKVSFLDCAGVGFLVQMKNMSQMWNGTFEICHLQKNVKLVLERLTLNDFLNVSIDTVSNLIHETV